ncbi:MAG TPA: hypothetical protein VFQ23_06245 [Anaerolineales bacterium]|nr:hypothetical protein [Anaerolineales bacterium]
MFNRKLIFLFYISVLLLTSCSGTSEIPVATATTATIATAPGVTAMPTNVLRSDVWEELLKATPYPHEVPLPEPVLSPLDGTYAKVDPSPPQFWTCYRCADYRPEGGPWRIQFDKGVMRIFYTITNWKSIASFTVDKNRLTIFNDPFCPHDIGEYEWATQNGALSLKTINDSCAFDLRKENLTKQSWLACTADGQDQVGCSDITTPPSVEAPAQLPVTVNVFGGDSHYFDTPPDVYAVANKDNVPSPDGIQIQFHDQTIGYGTHRVLWWDGDWIEATTDTSYTSIGVQLWGSGYLGWARVMFDDVEVWRGLTTSLGKEHAYFGGYIEITDFEPGTHIIRVENLGFDYRPVKVWAFGFSNQKVQPTYP